jgi:hypothetical protein
VGWEAKRVVCGYDEHGQSTVLSVGPPPTTISGSQLGIDPGFAFHSIWKAGQPDLSTEDSTVTLDTFEVPGQPGATSFVIGVFPPEKAPQIMHRTDTIDYIVILAGGINLKMADGTDVDLGAGDTLVELGADHQWWVKGDTPCVMAIVMVGVPGR